MDRSSSPLRHSQLREAPTSNSGITYEPYTARNSPQSQVHVLDREHTHPTASISTPKTPTSSLAISPPPYPSLLPPPPIPPTRPPIKPFPTKKSHLLFPSTVMHPTQHPHSIHDALGLPKSENEEVYTACPKRQTVRSMTRYTHPTSWISMWGTGSTRWQNPLSACHHLL